ncbi:gluzincin family metallopeptidase [Flavobacterium cyanobacteriorum]|uniref:aminopeptidase n=1 Tax=Flavobacterium cyanobacteriorum TaxID=2022802 RepID=UPI0029372B41|nr:aminopeptidase [Flavobacterium cyanobacteriorum]
MNVKLDDAAKKIQVRQELVYHNQSDTLINAIVLNDWNNAYSGKETPLARRFSDEFVRAFHLASEEERGNTTIFSVVDQNGLLLNFQRPEGHPDLIEIQLKNPVYPNKKFTIIITYTVKLPKDRFTRFGYDDKGNYNLRDWYLSPARFENNIFVRYSNENLDDIANAVADYDLFVTLPEDYFPVSDMYMGNKTSSQGKNEYYYTGKGLTNFYLIIEKGKSTFATYRTATAEVNTNIKNNRTTEVQRAVLIEQIVNFTDSNLGRHPYGKILVTQADYDRSPMYGLNQLPSFISPFPDSFLYEIRFLKTYLNTYLKSTLKLDPRKDSWIYDGIQIYLMMKYIEEYHPDKHMMGDLGDWWILKGFNLFRIDFNGQYNYLYLLMARKNLDQPIGDPKDTFIKFNEQIAGKYRAGLSLNYLDSYLGSSIVSQSVKEFFELNKSRVTNRDDFRNLIRSNTPKNIDWFFDTVVQTRELIDYKFGSVNKEGDSLRVTVKNSTGTNVPVSVYGLNKSGNVVFSKWLENIKSDSTFVIPRLDTRKLVLNYNNEIPEYNTRNNWKNLGGVLNRPLKFTFFQDLEDPRYNQVFYVPSFVFNLYDGVSAGLRFHNKSLLERPFIFDIEPTYSTKTGNLIGSFSFLYNHYIREGTLYNIRYGIGASTFHYAPDAAYVKFTPSVQLRIRDEDFRKNRKEFLLGRYVMVDREASVFADTDEQNENYAVFNLRYSKFETEITRHYNLYTDVQLAGNFGKLSGEVQFRRLFNDNRQINLRLFAGAFMYRSTDSEFFSFGLDRPTDYMFDYNFYGRSEETGLFSQQYVMAEGGFKSILDTRFANQWMTTVNASFNIWNWIEVYGDAGLFKNRNRDARFVYDSGIRLNLVPDYFELYLPVYSSNGFELDGGNYSQKIRFVVTISPGTLINLFTRKWF